MIDSNSAWSTAVISLHTHFGLLAFRLSALIMIQQEFRILWHRSHDMKNISQVFELVHLSLLFKSDSVSSDMCETSHKSVRSMNGPLPLNFCIIGSL